MDKRLDIRNIAIIAHVDHGKTTLVNEMLKQSGTVKEVTDRVMDSQDLERERGITILAKNTSIRLPSGTINIVDTPGHLDFSGEVERTLQMVEGFLLLVDAAEGPLPGTRFVLRKALELNLKPIVVINKIDRKDADIERTEDLVQELFLDLATHEDQLVYPVLYGSSRGGYMSTDKTKFSGDLQPLFEAISLQIPPPTQTKENLQLLIINLDYSEYLGRIGVGRVFNGTISVGKQIVACKGSAVSKPIKVTKLYTFEGIIRKETDTARFGDIVAIAGFEEEITIGSTVCDVETPDPVDYRDVDEPTLSIDFSVNNSPFSGKEGSLVTSRQIKERLEKEIKTNLALRVEGNSVGDSFKVSGRGQLHIGILVEEMRREGFELQLSAPEVIYKTVDGEKHEPYELLIIDVEDTYQGTIMENLGRRKALMENLEPYGSNKVRLEFKIPARGLIGFRSTFLTETRGTGMMSHQFLGYFPYAGPIQKRTKGAMISMENGKVTGYALDNLQERGTLFVQPADMVYEGMVIGENSRDNDLEANPTKEKKLTNMRASGSDDAIKLTPPKRMTLEEAMDWINDDELIEVTPSSVRLRKRGLKAHERKRS